MKPKQVLYFRDSNGQWIGARATEKEMSKLKDTACFFGFYSMATAAGLLHMGVPEEDVKHITVRDFEG